MESSINIKSTYDPIIEKLKINLVTNANNLKLRFDKKECEDDCTDVLNDLEYLSLSINALKSAYYARDEDIYSTNKTLNKNESRINELESSSFETPRINELESSHEGRINELESSSHEDRVKSLSDKVMQNMKYVIKNADNIKERFDNIEYDDLLKYDFNDAYNDLAYLSLSIEALTSSYVNLDEELALLYKKID
jgi:predicted RNase H-like nuclease (RuvC/YqgF family)